MNQTTYKPLVMVDVRNNYGAPAVYPVCQTAKTFANISGKKTLTKEVRELIKSLGYRIEQRAQSIDL